MRFLKKAIPRGIIYHSLLEDIKWFICSLFVPLDNREDVKKFEKEFSNLISIKYCVAFPFARTAIYFALKNQKLPRGSEIIMPPISIKGVLDVVLQLGLKPVFVDLDPDTLCFDEVEFDNSINKNTKAVLLTYLFGIVPNLNTLILIAKKHKLFVIEDFSQCLNGSFKDKKVGTFGDVGVYSASSIKTLDTYGGGLLITNNNKIFKSMLIEQAKLKLSKRSFLIRKILTDIIRNVATNRFVFSIFVIHLLKIWSRISPNSLLKQTGDRDISMINSMPAEWFQSFTSLQAKIGLSIIPRLYHQDIERINNVERLKSMIKPKAVIFPSGVKDSRNIYWQLIGYIKNNIEVQRKIQSFGVDTARSSLLQISNLKAYSYRKNTPKASNLYNNGYFIPSYPGLSNEDLIKIAASFNSLS